MKPKILVTRAVFPEVIERLSQHFDVEPNQQDISYDEDELARRLQGKDGVFSNPTDRISAAVIQAAPGLKAVCNMAVGYNNIDVAAATAAGVMVTNTPDVLNETTADLGWALMMAAARRITESERSLRAGLDAGHRGHGPDRVCNRPPGPRLRDEGALHKPEPRNQ